MGLQWAELGTLFVDKQSKYADGVTELGWDECPTIEIGNTQRFKEILWVKPDGMNLLIADRPILFNVGWDNLDANFLTHGRYVSIDGNKYKCRLLDVGDQEGVPNEWDTALNASGTDDNVVWHWGMGLFWGVNKNPQWGEGYRVVRGNVRPRYYGARILDTKAQKLGFRPALEPCPPDPSIINTIDWKVNLDGQGFAVRQMPGIEDSFCPQLIPLTGTPLDSVSEGSELRMYTLLINDNPVRFDLVEPRFYRRGTNLALTDRFFGEEFLIPWVISNGMAIASKALLHWSGYEEE